LQAGYVVGLLAPYHRSFRKRLVKTPKLFFYDTGLACHLLGIQEPAQLESHPLRKALFETWVFAELSKNLINHGERPNLFFWKTHGGQEVDFVMERGGAVDLIEVKSGATVAPDTARRLEAVSETWETAQKTLWVVHGGREEMRVRGATLLPWRHVFRPGEGRRRMKTEGKAHR
jgi:predicted AAA+ superfamily ATPase